jgi:nanoRNase/pAp phosphatase (c-di-AMP/oligoRNAs hydrolase)
MKTSFGKSVSAVEKVNKLKSIVGSGDCLAILLTADPDALASALALRRLFWRRVQPIHIVCTNRIDRANNLALINLLDIPLTRFRSLKNSEITKWALVDFQSSHNEQFAAPAKQVIADDTC